MKKLLSIFILFNLGFLSLHASDTLDEFDTQFAEQMAQWLNNEISNEELLRKMNGFDVSLSRQTASWKNLQRRAQVSLTRGQMLYETDQKKLSLEALEKSRDYAGKSINLNNQSDTWRILSEASSLIMLQKGMFYIIANFTEALDQAKEALKLEENNERAALIVAQFLCAAPAIAGGDLQEGLSIMKNLLQRTDLTELDRFLISRSLSDVLIDERRWSEAETYCLQALLIYPSNKISLEQISKIRKKKRD